MKFEKIENVQFSTRIQSLDNKLDQIEIFATFAKIVLEIFEKTEYPNLYKR